MARQARQKEKQAKRLDAKQKGVEGDPDAEAPDAAEDPDLAGIVLGPQPPADDEADENDESSPPGRD